MMLIETQAVGPFFKNGFVVTCKRTREAVLIDPGDEIDGLLAYVEREKLAVRHILLTHAHLDHVTGVGAAKAASGAPIHLHRDDVFLYERTVEQARMFGLPVAEPPPPVDAFYQTGEVIQFGECSVTAYHTPGHCPGGVCLEIASSEHPTMELFVGDTLFAGSIGRTDLPGGDYQTLISSIRNVLFRFRDDARVHPGHGPTTTIGEERRTNPFLNRE